MQNKLGKNRYKIATKIFLSPKGLFYVEVCWRPCMPSYVWMFIQSKAQSLGNRLCLLRPFYLLKMRFCLFRVCVNSRYGEAMCSAPLPCNSVILLLRIRNIRALLLMGCACGFCCIFLSVFFLQLPLHAT